MTMTMPLNEQSAELPMKPLATQSVVIHGHFYQPPREDPWLEVVEVEPSAAPDHDWNARIDRECYGRFGATAVRRRDPRAARRDNDARVGISRLVNLYAWCSFDVGATLCEWLDVAAPDTLEAMQAGDAASVRRTGHGNAIAAPYHHVILPLASRRDKVTEVRWGMADFRRRFNRDADGMWLPECAVDEETLDVLAQEGIRFTILAPYQVRGAEESRGMPVRWRAANGRSISILPYDGNLAGEVAFGGLLQNAGALAHRLAPWRDVTDDAPRCTTLATDGETFGHHHKGGDATLAESMALMLAAGHGHLTNPAALIAKYPPNVDVSLVSPSAWSCAHGVERWRSNCGCRLDGSKPPAQEWRGPLRVALTALADQAHAIFETEGRALFRQNPWDVRDAYGAVVAQDGDTLSAFVRQQVNDNVTQTQSDRARGLLELERATLRTFTSCAWFFDEVERIETRQVLRYAARVLELSGVGNSIAADFVQALTSARGSVVGTGSAADMFVREALPQRDAAWSVAAGVIACAAQGLMQTRVASYDASVSRQGAVSAAPASDGATWAVTLTHRRTGQVAELAGTVSGAGATTLVTLSERNVTDSATYVVPVYEFPESLALALLALSVNESDALG